MPAAARQASERPPVWRGVHPLVPLPFDPAKLRGLSERMIRSHHENNYGGALRNLNKVEEQLAQLGKDSPGFLVAGLKERELTFTNSVVLHELYFGNLGGEGKAGGQVADAITASWGSLGRWEEEFRALGASLGGGSGWVLFSMDLGTGELRTNWSGHHTQTRAAGLPLLVMDMYEHSYQMDYGAAAGPYIEAFFQNVKWEEVERRFLAAQRAAKALKG
jgi:superoxide dismutase, Fe-Mn family